MIKRKRKWKYILPIGVLVLTGVFTAMPKEDTSADYIAADIFHANTANTNMVFQLVEEGPTGDYYYQTCSRHHTSDTVHQTIALEFSMVRDEFVEENGWHPKDWKYPTSQNANPAVDPHEYATRADGSVARVSVVMARYDDPGVESYTQILDNGYELNTWKISYDALWNRIQQTQPAWYNELQAKKDAGEEYYFGVDAIKTIIYDYDDSLSSELNYKIHGNGNLTIDPITKLPSYDGQDTLYIWSNWDTDSFWKKEIENYYNKYFRGNHNPVDTPEVSEPEIETDDTFIFIKGEDPSGESNIGKGTGTNQSQDEYAAPRVYTYNESSEFNVGVGIPTTESYENHMDVSSWYGSVEVTKRDYSRQFNLVYKVKYTVKQENWMNLRVDAIKPPGYIVVSHYNEGGVDMVRGYTVTNTPYISPGEGVSSTWEGSYYAITDINLYELSPGTTTTNNSVNPSTVSYTAAAHVPYTATINGTTFSSGSSTATDQRYSGTFAIQDSNHVVVNNDQIDLSDIIVDVGTAVDNDTDALIEGQALAQAEADRRIRNHSSIITLINDELTINGALYLDQDGLWKGSKGNALTFTSGGTYEMAEANKIQSDTITDQKTRTIPENKANGYYYTDITAKYQRFMYGNSTISLSVWDSEDNSKKAIKPGWTDNEPVVVHSPVIAPITIEGENKTQLAHQAVGYTQLLLDGTYTIDFTKTQYFDLSRYKGYDAVNRLAGYIKYVKKKELMFPFDVYVDGTYYPIDDTTGYTEWISFPADTTSCEIYIPSWAKEGVYYKTGYSGYDAINRTIKVRCSANNYNSILGDLAEQNYNSDLKNYQAVFDFPVEVSGILYDFQVVSVFDNINFSYPQWEDTDHVYNFVTESRVGISNDAEKNVGVYNRLGTEVLRYTIDGMKTDSWLYCNTLPMGTGKSGVDSTGGYLVRGNKIAFTVKTIANLDGSASYMKLKPTFRYAYPDGTVLESDQIKVYYDNTSDYYIEMGSEKDLEHAHGAYLHSYPQTVFYRNCYFNYFYNTIDDTALLEGVHHNEIMRRYQEDCYCLGDITLTSKLRLLTGNEEELAANLTYDPVTGDQSVMRYSCFAGGVIGNPHIIDNLDDMETYNEFKASMQTWYGMYLIPSSIKVCPADVDLSDYDYLDGTEDFWLDDGYLILGFEIETFRDGDNEHLLYYAGNGVDPDAGGKDMWDIESNGGEGTGTYPEGGAQGAGLTATVPIRSGDIAIINLNYDSVDDHWTEGILYLN